MMTDKNEVLPPFLGEDRFEVLTQVLPELIWWTDQDGATTYATSRTLRYFGASSEHFMGKGWIDFVHPEDQGSTLAKWNEGVSKCASFEFEHRLRRHDGEQIIHLTRGMPVFNADGVLTSFVRTSTDISSQKKAESALRQSDKLADVGKLASIIAHEINNPLESVTNLLYLLAGHGSLDRTAREYVKVAQEELARISAITTQTLHLHRRSRNAVSTRIADVLDSVLSFYKPRIQAGKLELFREYRSIEPLVCSAGEIRQLLSNIVGNAIEATAQEGRLRVRLRSSRDWKTREKLGIRITVADTGRGISREDQQRIFEPFFTTKGVNGTGLGLWITRDLLHKHNGVISLRSSTKAGASGTVTSIYLPFEWIEHPDEEEPKDSALKFV